MTVGLFHPGRPLPAERQEVRQGPGGRAEDHRGPRRPVRRRQGHRQPAARQPRRGGRVAPADRHDDGRRRNGVDDGRAYREGGRGACADRPRSRCPREGNAPRPDGDHVGGRRRPCRGDRRAHQIRRGLPSAARFGIHAAAVCDPAGAHRRSEDAAEGAALAEQGFTFLQRRTAPNDGIELLHVLEFQSKRQAQ